MEIAFDSSRKRPLSKERKMAGGGVKQYMTMGVPTIGPETEVREAVRRLNSASGGIVAVCDRGRLVGSLTQHDVSNGHRVARASTLRVADVLQPDLSYCFEDTEVEEAERLMHETGVDRMVVLDRHGHAVGTLSLENVPHRRAV
jgi:predicted transcriptional regulator